MIELLERVKTARATEQLDEQVSYLEQRAKRFDFNEEGFTLIELMVVVVIIGILVAISVPIIMNIVGEAKFAGVKNDVRITVPELVALEAEGFRIDSGSCHGFSGTNTCSVQVETGTMGEPVRSSTSFQAPLSDENTFISIHRVGNASAGYSRWWACGYTFSDANLTETRAWGYNSATGKSREFADATACQRGEFL